MDDTPTGRDPQRRPEPEQPPDDTTAADDAAAVGASTDPVGASPAPAVPTVASSAQRGADMRRRVAEVATIERQLAEAAERQLASPRLAARPEAAAELTALVTTLRRHVSALDHYLRGQGEAAPRGEVVASAWGRMAGSLTGVLGKVRAVEASRLLRDDLAALSLAAATYETLHATALAVHEIQIARIALTHLGELPPHLSALARQVARVAVADAGGDEAAVDEAERNASEALALHAR